MSHTTAVEEELAGVVQEGTSREAKDNLIKFIN
jgi:hypothetical protein